MRHLLPAFSLAAALLVGATASQAVSFNEIGDATALLPGQYTGSGASLESISGTLSSGNDADLYRITILDASVFSVSVAQSFDAQIFLFDAAGNGIAMNDDYLALFAPSQLPAGNALYSGLAPGEYLLGISEWDNDPVDAGNNEIFPDTFTTVNGPNGGVGPLAGWNGSGFGDGGSYTLRLTGAAPSIPEPTAGLLFAAGFGAVALQRRRRA